MEVLASLVVRNYKEFTDENQDAVKCATLHAKRVWAEVKACRVPW